MTRNVRRRVSFNVPESESDHEPQSEVHAPVTVSEEPDKCLLAKYAVATRKAVSSSSGEDDVVSLASSSDGSGSMDGSEEASREPRDISRVKCREESEEGSDSGSEVDSEGGSEVTLSGGGGFDRRIVTGPEKVGDPVEDSGESDNSSDDSDDGQLADENESPGHVAGAEETVGCHSVKRKRQSGESVLSSRSLNSSIEQASVPRVSSFVEMKLDDRISWAVAKLGWRRPTPVQCCAVPAALAGRDVLVSAPTGSGKTAAYAIPLTHQLCRVKVAPGVRPAEGTFGLVLVPTRELAAQVTTQLRKLLKHVEGVHVACLTGGMSEKKSVRKREKTGSKQAGGTTTGEIGQQETRSTAFARTADVLVGTPAAVVSLRKEHGDDALEKVQFVVVDEADLVLGFGHGADAHAALSAVPSNAQAMLVSATLDAEGLQELRNVVLRHPITVKVSPASEEDTPASGTETAGQGASHYFARLGRPQDRYLVTYAMLRLNVLTGKVLIFVNGISSAFRLKLFLDQFKLKSAVLNSELPANSRIHCVEQFNAGIFDILIATDQVQHEDQKPEIRPKKRKRTGGDASRADIGDRKEGEASSSEEENEREYRPKKDKSRLMSKANRDAEFGVSRGVDFRGVAAVINFDVPETPVGYTHRAGRTARGGASGTVLSLVVSDAEQSKLVNMAHATGVHVGPLAFRMDQIEAFRYRVEDCLRAVTDTAVHEARLTEVRCEMINSDRLKDYFEENPMDLDALKHDMALAKHVPEHLAHVPGYLLPPALRDSMHVAAAPGRRRPGPQRRGLGSRNATRRPDDPLRTFSTQKRHHGTSKERYVARHGVKKKQSKGQKFKALKRAGKRK